MTWEPPAWAEGKSMDQQITEWCRSVGEGVDIVQLEEIDRTPDEPVVVRSDPMLRIHGTRYDVEQAGALVDAIVTALRLLG